MRSLPIRTDSHLTLHLQISPIIGTRRKTIDRMNLPRDPFVFLLAFVAFLALAPLKTSARLIGIKSEDNAVAVSKLQDAKNHKRADGAPINWVCRPERHGWCTVTIVTEYDSMPNIHGELFDNNCTQLAKIPNMSWGVLYMFPTSALPRNVRIEAHPVISAVSPDISEFWYGDGHWLGNWEQYIDGKPTDNNFKGISTRPFDCSFVQGHQENRGVALQAMSTGVIGLLVALVAAWVIVF